MPTPTTVATCPRNYQRGYAVRAQQLLQEISLVPRHPGRRLDLSSPTPRSGRYYRTPIGSRSRWRHRGDVRDALDRATPSILGTRSGPSAFSPRNFALRGRHPEPAPPTIRLYRRMRIGAAQRELSWSNGERFLHSAMAAYRTPTVFNATAIPWFPTGPTVGARATTVCGGHGKSARLRQRMVYIWFEFGTTWDRSSFRLLQRKRLRPKLHEVLGVCKCTCLARLFRGPSVKSTNLEAPPWIADFRFSAALDCFFLTFSWSLGGDCSYFLTFSEFSGRLFVWRCVSCLFIFFLGLVGGGVCVFCPAYPPALSVGAGLVTRATNLWHITRFQSCGLGLGGSWCLPCYFSSRFLYQLCAFPCIFLADGFR